MSLPARVLEEPALRLSMHAMMLVIDQFPWRLTIPPTKHCISVRDLLSALKPLAERHVGLDFPLFTGERLVLDSQEDCFLRHPVHPSEYSVLHTQALGDEVLIAFHNRCRRAPSEEAAGEPWQKGWTLCGPNAVHGTVEDRDCP